MIEVVLEVETDVAGWRAHARSLLLQRVPPEDVVWRVAESAPDLFAGVGGPASHDRGAPPAADGGARISRRFLELAEAAIGHRDPERFALLYRMLWRMTAGDEPRLIEDASDPLVARLRTMAAAVRRDVHKMHAFVRFREVAEATAGEGATGEDSAKAPVYVAWFEPAQYSLARAAPFFVERFSGMRWSILTPDASAHWDGTRLVMASGARRADAPDGDALEALWRRYYRSIFNPARLKLDAMRAQMPRRYWPNLPEAPAIAELSRAAGLRTEAMLTAAPTPPRRGGSTPVSLPPPAAAGYDGSAGPPSPAVLRREAAGCRACPLWQAGTQTVFGEGPERARLMLVGEQPGDQEDLQGRPFVGPAGGVLDRALAEAGIDRTRVWVTNAVKHFKFMARGRRRIHQKPDYAEIDACRRWLDGEIAAVQPEVVVAMGATAARAVLGRSVTIGRVRGQFLDQADGRRALVTVHPSFLLRLPDDDAKAREYRAFVDDLRRVAEFAGGSGE